MLSSRKTLFTSKLMTVLTAMSLSGLLASIASEMVAERLFGGGVGVRTCELSSVLNDPPSVPAN